MRSLVLLGIGFGIGVLLMAYRVEATAPYLNCEEDQVFAWIKGDYPHHVEWQCIALDDLTVS